MNCKRFGIPVLLLLLSVSVCIAQTEPVTAPGAEVEKLAGGFGFTEGPAADIEGNVYFTDIPNNRIHKWTVDPCQPGLSTFLENSEGANGLYFDKYGDLIACQGGGRKLVLNSFPSIYTDPSDRKVTTIAETYNGKRFNSPNDCWIDMKRGIYFTDPRYGNRDGMEQDGEHVYYLTPDKKKVIRVIDDMVRPNGVIGTPDGETLYVADHGDGKTFAYTINEDGALSDKRLFAPEGSDGMTIDEEGNVYLTTNAVAVYNKDGKKIQTIKVPEGPANVAFGGKDRQTLFITARTSLYSIKTRVKGARQVNQFKYEPIVIGDFPVTMSIPSLVDKPLSDLKDINITLPPEATDKMILVCIFDMNQRPSRNCVIQLAKKADELAKQGIVVTCVQLSYVDEKPLDEWVKENKIPFTISRAAPEKGKSQSEWGTKSLPWLILTNREHIVTAEGFGLSELNEKITQAGAGSKFEQDIIETSSGNLKISFIGHGTLMFEFAGKIIHIDPVGAEADYSPMPKADLILVTHTHGDHLDLEAIKILRKEGTKIVLTKACAERVSGGIIMNNGDTQTVDGLKIEAIPAYNIVHTRSGNNPYHPKGDGNGYIITFGDKRVYVAGDTENTPEMKDLKNIDIAFLPMNLPYTMTPEMVADAAGAFKPKILYPYHYGQTDTQKLVDLLKDSKEIEVRIRDMK